MSDIIVSFPSVSYIWTMLTNRQISKGLSRLSREDRIRVGLLILGLTTDEAAAILNRHPASVRGALSRGDRKPVLDDLEALILDNI